MIKEAIELYNELKSQRKTAEALGITRHRLREILKDAIPPHGLVEGWNRDQADQEDDLFNDSLGLTKQELSSIPQGHYLDRTTIHVTRKNKETGEITNAYLKTKTKLNDTVNILSEAIKKAITDDVRPYNLVVEPKEYKEDLLNLYTLTDSHVGAYAFANETNDDWDCDIAEQTFIPAMRYLLDNSPNSEYGFVNQLGDYFCLLYTSPSPRDCS